MHPALNYQVQDQSLDKIIPDQDDCARFRLGINEGGKKCFENVDKRSFCRAIMSGFQAFKERIQPVLHF